MPTYIEFPDLNPMEENNKPEEIKETWVNLYKDHEGRFLGDTDFGSKELAFENRDQVSTYLCPIRITDQSISEECKSERERTLNEVKDVIDNLNYVLKTMPDGANKEIIKSSVDQLIKLKKEGN